VANGGNTLGPAVNVVVAREQNGTTVNQKGKGVRYQRRKGAEEAWRVVTTE